MILLFLTEALVTAKTKDLESHCSIVKLIAAQTPASALDNKFVENNRNIVANTCTWSCAFINPWCPVSCGGSSTAALACVLEGHVNR